MTKLIRIALVIGGSVLAIYLSGQFPIQVTGMAVPITLQSLLVLVLPMITMGFNGVAGVALFLMLGALGLPIFADSSGGIEYFYSNSGGYLVGFFVVALLAAILKDWVTQKGIVTHFLLFIVLHLVLTAIGLLWIYLIDISTIQFSTHVSPYLVGIIVKSFLAALTFQVYILLAKSYRLSK